MKKVKVLISQCYGGFGLTQEVLKEYEKVTGKDTSIYDIPRHDKDLIRIVEKIGLVESADTFAELTIVEIPGVRYSIIEYDGYESTETPEDYDWTIVDSPESREQFPEYFL